MYPLSGYDKDTLLVPKICHWTLCHHLLTGSIITNQQSVPWTFSSSLTNFHSTSRPNFPFKSIFQTSPPLSTHDDQVLHVILLTVNFIVGRQTQAQNSSIHGIYEKAISWLARNMRGREQKYNNNKINKERISTTGLMDTFTEHKYSRVVSSSSTSRD